VVKAADILAAVLGREGAVAVDLILVEGAFKLARIGVQHTFALHNTVDVLACDHHGA
jgi:hypothetical protein